jgi:hypothetical protein
VHDKQELKLLSTSTYENGVVRLHYVPRALESKARPANFTELLTESAPAAR